MEDKNFEAIAASLGLTPKQFQTHLDTNYKHHSVFSPSGSAMWINCPGSLLANILRHDKAGRDAAEGTVAHSLGEGWLNTGIRPDSRIGEVVIEDGFEICITATMIDYAQEYVDRCICLPGDHFVEVTVDHSHLTPIEGQTGTSDHIACAPGELCISDLKYGKGVQVYAENNTQGLIYAHATFIKYDALYHFEKIKIRILQPRLDHYDDWEITRNELLAWGEKIKLAAHNAWKPGAVRVPGTKQCMWCKAKPDCAAFAIFATRLYEGIFDNLEEPICIRDMTQMALKLDGPEYVLVPVVVGSLTTPQKAKLLPFRKMIESWLKELNEDLENRALAGEDVPGFKLVRSRADRQIRDEVTAADHLEFLGVDADKLYSRKMVGIGKIEELLQEAGYGRKMLPGLLEPIVVKPEGGIVLAPDSDKRKAVENENGAFDNLDDSEL